MSITQTRRQINAPVADIFDLLATPARHNEIDGSGTVAGVLGGTPQRLTQGATFGMRMHWGVGYKIRNEVVEFDEPTRIAWRHFGGHVWRYLLDPVDQTTTMVTEQFDDTPSRSPLVLKLINARRRNLRSMERTLERLDEWAIHR